MTDFLDKLAFDAIETVDEGYYKKLKRAERLNVSLKQAIIESKAYAVITEIKAASPSAGTIKSRINPKTIAKAMEKGGAVGISVLTEPKNFNGSLDALVKTREVVKLPILMKDIIVSKKQLDAAAKIGADAVLLIKAVFDREYAETDLNEMLDCARSKGLEVLLEAHSKEEFTSACETNADLVGINNRNLSTLKVDLNVTEKILSGIAHKSRIVISESGIKTPKDVICLHENGADAFLIGTSIMLSKDIEGKVKEFVYAK